MAGPHQIWKMPLKGRFIGPYAGNGREDIVDGPLLPSVPYELGFSSFAQPSGLASDGEQLFVADSEGSAIRAVPFDLGGNVPTIVGVPGTLFDFGDVDGVYPTARLQHPLGVAFADGNLYIADTYNNKIRTIDLRTNEVKTFLGGQPKKGEEPLFNEPAGLSIADGKLYVADTNAHRIRIVDLKTKAISTLDIKGIDPVKPAKE